MKRLQNLLLLLLTIAFSSTALMANAGSGDENKIYNSGKKALLERDYASAASLFSSLAEMDGTNAEYQFLAGLSYFEGGIEREKSIPFFESSVANFNRDTIAEVYYYLAKAYCLNGEFDKGIAAYQQFDDFIISGKKAGMAIEADIKQEQENAEFAKSAMTSSNTNFKVTNMGPGVNTIYADYAPVITPDGKTLLFTSRREGTTGDKKAFDEMYYEDIYMASNPAGTWEVGGDGEASEYLFENFNTSKQDAGVVYTQNGQRLYIYRNDKIYESIFENDAWTQPEKMDKIDHKAKHVPSVTLSEDGKTMFFVNNRKDGFGGRDLFKTTMGDDGEWADPENLGATINTDGDEDAPHLSNDGKTLYFSSNGHVGIGGFDVFKVELQSDGTWSDPINMGAPINSPADDIYYVESKDGEMAYLSSSRIGTNGAMDLYAVSLNPPAVDMQLAGIAFDPDAKAPLAVTITLKDTESGEVFGPYTPDPKTGTYSISVPSDKSYEMTVVQNGGDTYTNTFNVPKQTLPYTSYQMLEIRDLNDTEGKTIGNELTMRTGLFDVKDRAESAAADLDQGKMGETLVFLKDGDANIEENVLLSTYLSDAVDVNDPLYLEWNEKKDFATADIANLGDQGIFKKEFDYNEKTIIPSEAKFAAWIDVITTTLAAGNEVTLYLEASASRVPTSQFRSNKRLAQDRSNDTKALVIKALKEKGADVSKIKWEEKHLVQGPAYQGDFDNTAAYKAWQYVIVKVK